MFLAVPQTLHQGLRVSTHIRPGCVFSDQGDFKIITPEKGFANGSQIQ